MEKQVEYVADAFIRTLQSSSEVIEYTEALEKFEYDNEIKILTERYNSLAKDFQKKQYNGTLTQDEINELRTASTEIQNNFFNKELDEKENVLKIILQGCNAVISGEILMDFAKLAVPSSGCCG